MYKVIIFTKKVNQEMGRYPTEKEAQRAIINLSALSLTAYYMKDGTTTASCNKNHFTNATRAQKALSALLPIQQLPLLKLAL